MGTAIPVLVIIALVAAVALCGVAIWAALEVAKAARSSRRLAEDLDERLVPLAEKADVTADAVNAELLRVDIIVGQVEEMIDRLTGTADTVREVVDAPMHLVTEVADRLRRGLRHRGTRHHEEHAPHAAGDGLTLVDVVITDGAAEGPVDAAAENVLDRAADEMAGGVTDIDDAASPTEPDSVAVEPDTLSSSTDDPEEA